MFHEISLARLHANARPKMLRRCSAVGCSAGCSCSAVAELLGIVRILDVEDICDTPMPDKKIVMTYVAEYFKKFAKMATAGSE